MKLHAIVLAMLATNIFAVPTPDPWAIAREVIARGTSDASGTSSINGIPPAQQNPCCTDDACTQHEVCPTYPPTIQSGSGKCGPENHNPPEHCPGVNCIKTWCYYLCCYGPAPATNPLSCATVPEQCSCADSCTCCLP